MNHDLVRAFAQYLLYILILLLPALVVYFSDRFRRQPDPAQYAVLFLIGMGIGILLYLPAISIISGTALFALLLARTSGRYSLTGVTVQRTLANSRLFPGDATDLQVAVVNRKLLPLASLSIITPIRHGLVRPGADLSDHLAFSGGIELLDDLGHALVIRTAVGPFRSLRRTYRVVAQRRGAYRLDQAAVESSDPFGIFPRHAFMDEPVDLIVYPRIYRPDEIGLPLREALGEVVARHALHEDPTLLAGSREYRAGDPLNKMHWKATARTRELQVRVSDPSTTARLMLVLNLNTYQHLWQGIDLDRMEAALELGGSVAVWALDHNFSVGVHSNGVVPGLDRTPRVAPSAHPQQAAAILEHLARLTFSGRYSAEEVLDEESRRIPAGGSIIFVTSIITPALVATLTSRRLTGRVSVVYCGRFAAPVVRGVPIYLATPPQSGLRAVS